jgi:hypothetical protein
VSVVWAGCNYDRESSSGPAIFDAADIDKVGSFYAELTGWDVVRQDPDRFGVRTPDGQEVEFQRAPDHVAPRWPGQEHP